MLIENLETADTTLRDDEEGNTFLLYIFILEVNQTSIYSNQKKFKLLIFSALLRVIYVSIEYALSHEHRKRCVAQLKKLAMIQPLTELACKIGWEEPILTSKYLHVMRLVMQESVGIEDESLMINFFEIVAKAVLDIGLSAQKKLNKIGTNKLSKADKSLIQQLSITSSLLCSQIANLPLPEIQPFERKNHMTIGVKSFRESVNEFLLAKILPPNVIYTFLDILFLIMGSEFSQT